MNDLVRLVAENPLATIGGVVVAVIFGYVSITLREQRRAEQRDLAAKVEAVKREQDRLRRRLR